MKIKKIIQQFDLFGVPLELRIINDGKYKTFLGGITSILVYSLSVAYGLYQLSVWFSNGYLPFVTDQTLPIVNDTYTFHYSPIKMELARLYMDPPLSGEILTASEDRLLLPIIVALDGYTLDNHTEIA